MKKIYSCDLHFEKSLDYFIWTLNDVNILSSEILRLTNFTFGRFFTLLPKNANLEKIHDFETGDILQQNPVLNYELSGKKCSYSIIPTIRIELSDWILKKINSNKKLCVIFDDVIRSRKDKCYIDLINDYRFFYNDEVYYALSENTISTNLILQCLRASNSFWHSLCVITSANINQINNQEFNQKSILDICLNAHLIIVGAYDGEGYVIWERSAFPITDEVV